MHNARGVKCGWGIFHLKRRMKFREARLHSDRTLQADRIFPCSGAALRELGRPRDGWPYPLSHYWPPLNFLSPPSHALCSCRNSSSFSLFFPTHLWWSLVPGASRSERAVSGGSIIREIFPSNLSFPQVCLTHARSDETLAPKKVHRLKSENWAFSTLMKDRMKRQLLTVEPWW